MNWTRTETVGESTSQVATGRDWTSAPLAVLIRHIVDTHHRYLRDALPRLTQLAEEVVQARLENHGDTLLPVQQTIQELRGELESHMWKEEMVLFPLVIGLEEARMAGRSAPPVHCGSVLNPIRVMEREHATAGRALAELRRLTSDYTPPGDASQSYRALYAGLAELEADLHQHIHLEDNTLFPRAAELEAALA